MPDLTIVKRLLAPLAALALLLLTTTGCEELFDLPEPCSEGEERACNCLGGGQGTQTCGENGIYGGCMCEDGGGGNSDMEFEHVDCTNADGENSVIEISRDLEGNQQQVFREGQCYFIDGTVTLPRLGTGRGELVVERGAKVIFGEGARLVVGLSGKQTGNIVAKPNSLFTGSKPEAGWWNGVVINHSGEEENKFTGVTMEYGGGGQGLKQAGLDPANLIVVGRKIGEETGVVQKLHIEQTLFRKSGAWGFTAGPHVGFTTFKKNDYRDNEEGTLLLHPNHLSLLGYSTFASNTGSGDDHVAISAGTVTEPTSIRPLNSGRYYRFRDTVRFEKTKLEVVSGSELRFEEGTALEWYGDGSSDQNFSIGGQTTNRVLLRGTEEKAGHWKGLALSDGVSAKNSLGLLDVHHAGGAPWTSHPSSKAAIALGAGEKGAEEDLNVAIFDVSVKDSGGAAFFVRGENVSVNTCKRISVENADPTVVDAATQSEGTGGEKVFNEACDVEGGGGETERYTGTYAAISVGATNTCAVRGTPPGDGSDPDEVRGVVDCWGESLQGITQPFRSEVSHVEVGHEVACGLSENGEIRCVALQPGGRIGKAAEKLRENIPSGTIRDLTVRNDTACALVEKSGPGVSKARIECWGDAAPETAFFDELVLSVVESIHLAVVGTKNGICVDYNVDEVECSWDDDSMNGYSTGRWQMKSWQSQEFILGLLGCGGTESGLECQSGGGDDQLYKSVLESAPSDVEFSAWTLGAGHGCGIRAGGPEAGSILCWGSNVNLAAMPPESGSYVAIEAGVRNSCALATDGTVTCWGNPLANRPEHHYQRPLTYRAIDGSYQRLCALTEDGPVICHNSLPFHIALPDRQDLKEIRTTELGVCLLDEAGTITCPIFDSPLADNQASVPTVVTNGTWKRLFAFHDIEMEIDGSKKMRDVFCAIDTNDTLTCWGKNGVYETGLPSTSGYKHMALAGDFACGLTTDDEIQCRTGRGDWSPFPQGRKFSSLTTAYQKDLSGGPSVPSRRVVCGVQSDNQEVSCELTNIADGYPDTSTHLDDLGTAREMLLYSPGDNDSGSSLLDGCAIKPDGSLACTDSDISPPSGTNFVDLTHTESLTYHPNWCAITDTGKLHCWGRNYGCQFGGETACAEETNPNPTPEPEGDDRYVMVRDLSMPTGNSDAPGADIDAIVLEKSDGTTYPVTKVTDSDIGGGGDNAYADTNAMLGQTDSQCMKQNFTALGGEDHYVIVEFKTSDFDGIIESGDLIIVYELGPTACQNRPTWTDDPYEVSVGSGATIQNFQGMPLGQGGKGQNILTVP